MKLGALCTCLLAGVYSSELLRTLSHYMKRPTHYAETLIFMSVCIVACSDLPIWRPGSGTNFVCPLRFCTAENNASLNLRTCTLEFKE